VGEEISPRALFGDFVMEETLFRDTGGGDKFVFESSLITAMIRSGDGCYAGCRVDQRGS